MGNYVFFEYGTEELQYLTKADQSFGGIIEKYGFIKRKIIPNLFDALTQSIIAQQISGKAADTVYARIKKETDITPYSIFNTDDGILRSCGLSACKVSYLKSGAEFFIMRGKELNGLNEMDDQSVIRLFTQIKGVGVWTAEMLLIFSLVRKNILSYNDLGIKKGLMKLYGLNEIDKKIFEECRNRYSPYCSIASFYLWAAAADT